MSTMNPRPFKTYRYPDRAGPPVTLPEVLGFSLGLPPVDAHQARARAVTMGDMLLETASVKVDLMHNGRRYQVRFKPEMNKSSVFRMEQLASTRLDTGRLRAALVEEAKGVLAQCITPAGVAK